jgi:CheY-like chemotaxis protein
MVEEQEQNSEDVPVKNILIIEDDASIGDMLVQVISSETPHRALQVIDGEKALEVLSEFRPDLFILDYHLPRSNGLEVYDRLHAMANLSHVPAILTSAGVMQYNIQDRHIVGISKPVDLNKLLDLIEELLT